MPLTAALAKHFWKLTGLSDGVWEEGKISPYAPRGLSLLRFCPLFSFSAVSHRIGPVGSKMRMSSGVHSCEVFLSILGGGAYEVCWVVCGRPEQGLWDVTHTLPA